MVNFGNLNANSLPHPPSPLWRGLGVHNAIVEPKRGVQINVIVT